MSKQVSPSGGLRPVPRNLHYETRDVCDCLDAFLFSISTCVFSGFSFVSKIFNNGRIVHLYQKLQKKIKFSPRGYKGASI